MRTVEKRWETSRVIAPCAAAASRAAAAKRSNSAASAGASRLAVGSSRTTSSGAGAHQPAGQGEPLPLAAGQLVAAGVTRRRAASSRPAGAVRRPARAGAVQRRPTPSSSEPRQVARRRRSRRPQLEAHEVLERRARPGAPGGGVEARPGRRRRPAPALGRAGTCPVSSLTRVVLPAPFSPTSATVAPAGSSRSSRAAPARPRVGEVTALQPDAAGQPLRRRAARREPAARPRTRSSHSSRARGA